jgi:outer membrane scaffolding protein for murein synthesis (MipA/OmpV family)
MTFPRCILATLGLLISLSPVERAARAEDRIPAKRPTARAKAPPAEAAVPPIVEAKPLWEVGLGGGLGWTPDYPAAGQNHVRGLGLPFVIFRGRSFQAGERSFARGLFVNTDRIEFDLSFAGSLPTDSSDNDAREGLDDLDFLGEVGPSLSYFIDRDEAGNQTRIDLQLRGVLSTDFSNFDYVGLVFHPVFAQEFVDVGGIEGLDTNWSISARWADEGVMDLFYEVPVADANAERAAFDAKAGYLGSSLYGAFSYRLTDYFRFALGGNIASYHGATNDDSDLFIDKVNVGVGMGLILTLWKSETLSEARP